MNTNVKNIYPFYLELFTAIIYKNKNKHLDFSML